MEEFKTTEMAEELASETQIPETSKKSKGKKRIPKVLKLVLGIVIAAILIAVIATLIVCNVKANKVEKYLDEKTFITGSQTDTTRFIYSFKNGYIAMEDWMSKDWMEGDINAFDCKYKVSVVPFEGIYISVKKDSDWIAMRRVELKDSGEVVGYYDDWHETTLEEIEQERKIYTCNHERTQEKEIEKATCSESGVKVKICLDCGFEEESTLDSLGHNYQNKICTVCGQEKPKEKSDIEPDTWYVYDNVLKFQNCKLSGVVFISKYQGFQVSYRPVCKNCNVVYGYPEMCLTTAKTSEFNSYVCKECNTTTYVRIELIQ